MKTYILAIFIVTFILLQTFISKASNPDSAFLKIGDKVPDIEFKIKNYIKSAVKFSDFKGKLVILDLWGVSCGPCIAAIPHMQELQKKFEGQIQIIMVTKDSKEQIDKLTLRSDNVRNNTLPSVVEAKELAGLFNYIFLPTHVWIDEQGVVQSITSGSETNEINIRKYFAGEKPKLREKKDLKLDRENPMLVNWYPYHKEISFYTYLAPAQTQYSASIMGSGQNNYPDGTIKRIYNGMATLKGLYKLAYGQYGENFSNSRVISLFKESQKYEVNPIKSYRDGGLYYSYDVINGVKLSNKQLFKSLQNELDVIFNVKSTWEKRDIECYVLKLKNSNKSIFSNEGQVKADYRNGIYTVENLKWELFLATQKRHAFLEIVDETFIPQQQLVNLSISTKWDDLDAINKSLANYGIYVQIEKRSFDCIVLKDAE